jgi:hypothetical protein
VACCPVRIEESKRRVHRCEIGGLAVSFASIDELGIIIQTVSRGVITRGQEISTLHRRVMDRDVIEPVVSDLRGGRSSAAPLLDYS